MCRLIAVSIVRNNDVRLVEPHEPLYQFKASDGDGASKYRIALLSTNRNAIGMHV